MKLRMLDRRNTGWDMFLYYAEPQIGVPLQQKVETFNLWRTWCWEQWGSSCELESYLLPSSWSNPKWCWSYRQEINHRIYIATETEATAFSMRWL